MKTVASGCFPFVNAAPSLLRLTRTSTRSAITIIAIAIITCRTGVSQCTSPVRSRLLPGRTTSGPREIFCALSPWTSIVNPNVISGAILITSHDARRPPAWPGVYLPFAEAAGISCQHCLRLVSTHDETGATARLIPFTVDGLILAASMLTLDANRRHHPVPPWRAGAWPPASWPLSGQAVARPRPRPHQHTGQRLASPGTRRLIRTPHDTDQNGARSQRHATFLVQMRHAAPAVDQDASPALMEAPSVAQMVLASHQAGGSQRAIARQLNIDRRRSNA